MLTGAEMMERLRDQLPAWVEDIEVREYVDSIGDDAQRITIYLDPEYAFDEISETEAVRYEMRRVYDAVAAAARVAAPDLFPYVNYRIRLAPKAEGARG